MSGLREALERLTYASDDGSEYEHTHQPWEGEPECPACWVEGIRQALAAHPAEPAPVASRERVAKVIEQAASDVDLAKYFLPGMTDRFVDSLLAAGVFRDEAQVKAEVLREAAISPQSTWDPGDLWQIIHDQIDGAVDVGAAISDAVNEIVELVGIRPVRSAAEMKAEAIESFAAQVGAWPDDARVPVMVVKALAAERAADLRAGEPSPEEVEDDLPGSHTVIIGQRHTTHLRTLCRPGVCGQEPTS